MLVAMAETADHAGCMYIELLLLFSGMSVACSRGQACMSVISNTPSRALVWAKRSTRGLDDVHLGGAQRKSHRTLAASAICSRLQIGCRLDEPPPS
jgi:hypothetical protein